MATFANRQRAQAQRAKTSSLRARARNITLAKSLDQTCDQLKVCWENKVLVLDRQLRDVRQSMPALQALPQTPRHVERSSRRVQSAPLTIDRSVTATPTKWPRKPRPTSSTLPTCSYEREPRHCRQFPCKTTSTYHCIGFDINILDREPTKRFTLSTPMSPTSKDRLIADLEATSIRRPISTAAEKSAVRERALRRMMADLKKRISRTTKPQDWNVNYGKPRRGMRTVLNSSSR